MVRARPVGYCYGVPEPLALFVVEPRIYGTVTDVASGEMFAA